MKSLSLFSWEDKGKEYTGLTPDQEKAFRMMVFNRILESEKSQYAMSTTLTKEFVAAKELSPIEVASNLDFSFVSNG
nr:hypothetical protein HAGR004_11970 [Bdellovibrio sp. HAGR004]